MVALDAIVPDALAAIPSEHRDPGREMAPAGPLDADLALVGEAPGANEAETGHPFVGRAGDVLDDALEAAGIDRASVYITAVVKIRPPDNRDPHRAELDAWRPVLDAELELVDPVGVVTLGAVATRELLGTDRRITDLRGRTVDGG
ncbi:MAG: uracil-DNA glycosylase, partial [Halobacteriales archaeon]|nr:uracil-DNA glycosylase [Halobacteriales archaeon]